MKKWMTLMLAMVLAVCCLTACGSKKEEAPAEVNVDLSAFYSDVEAECGIPEGYMADLEGEMLEGYYPGLAEIPAKQLIAKAPMMSAVVNEMVFMQCESEEDAAAAAEILQERVTMQAEGGAWYPESMEAWSKGEVIQQGTYVAMVASAEFQSTIVDAFNALFA